MPLVFLGLLNCLGLGHMVDACGGIAFPLSTIAMCLVYPVLSQQRRLVLRNPAKIVAGANQSMDMANLICVGSGGVSWARSSLGSCPVAVRSTNLPRPIGLVPRSHMKSSLPAMNPMNHSRLRITELDDGNSTVFQYSVV